MSPPFTGLVDATIVAVTVLLAGSIDETVPARLFITHTWSSPTARNLAPASTSISACSSPVVGSMRWTAEPTSSLTHNEPARKRIALAPEGAANVATIELSATLICAIWRSLPADITHANSSLAAMDDSSAIESNGRKIVAAMVPSAVFTRYRVVVSHAPTHSAPGDESMPKHTSTPVGTSNIGAAVVRS